MIKLPPIKLITAAAMALAVMMSSAVRAQDEVIIECNEEGKQECVLEGNRTCYNKTYPEFGNYTNECGYCLNGYIEIFDECFFIDDIPTEAFTRLAELLEEYLPEYVDQTITTEERAQRLVFVAKVISVWNSNVPPLNFELGINAETFLTLEERKGRLGTFTNRGDDTDFDNFLRFGGEGRKLRFERSLQDVPPSIDWVARGALTRVKQQGACGCCWAVSTAAAVEAALIITNQTTVDETPDSDSLSFQQMIDCDTENLGCNGGNILYATKYVWENNNFNNNNLGGLVSYVDWPYEDLFGSSTPRSCSTEGLTPKAYLNFPKIVTSVNDRTSFEERRDATMAAVAQQPVTSVIRSGCSLFMSYRGGVMTHDGDCACGATSCIDHAVVIVGYDSTANPPYWKLRNSWGPFWGEEGYFRIAMNDPGSGWGLFGMLAESALPGDVYTSLDQLPERPGWWQTAQGWEKALVVLASIVGFCLLSCCCYGLFTKYKQQ